MTASHADTPTPQPELDTTEVRVVLVDDQEADRQLAALLTTAETLLTVSAVEPQRDVEATVAAILSALDPGTRDGRKPPGMPGPPEDPWSTSRTAPAILLDYRLDEQQGVHYRGGTIAGAIKDELPDVPLVLLTTEERLLRWVVGRPEIHQLFDWQILKEDVHRDATRVVTAAALHSLATGYNSLAASLGTSATGPGLVLSEPSGEARDQPQPAEARRTAADAASSSSPPSEHPGTGWKIVESLLAPPPESVPDLRSAFAAQSDVPNPSAPSRTGRWITQSLMRHYGPLVDAPSAAAILGLSQADLDTIRDHPKVGEAHHTGLFAAFLDRFWAGSLRSVLDGTRLARDTRDRATQISELTGHDLVAARCRWCQEPDVTRACSTCRRPVDDAHSLPAAGLVPPWAAPDVICFVCVLDGSADQRQLDPEVRSIVHDIVSGAFGEPAPEPR